MLDSFSTPFRDFKGPLEVNYKLSEAEYLHRGVLRGPESIVFHKGNVGLDNSKILTLLK